MKGKKLLCGLLAALLLCSLSLHSHAEELSYWHYSVEYYVDGALYPQWSYRAAVPAQAPLVVGAEDRLSLLPGCYVESVPEFPCTLKANNEVMKICYRTQQEHTAQLIVQHEYVRNKRTRVGSEAQTFTPQRSSIEVKTLLQTAYGSKEYRPVSVLLSRIVPAAGKKEAQAVQTQLTTADSFVYEPGATYVLALRYDRDEPAFLPPVTLAVAEVQHAARLPRASGDTVLFNLAGGLAAGVCAVLLQRRRKPIPAYRA